METITIKINNASALKLLEDLESMKLIEFIKKSTSKVNGKKLSERLSGNISHEESEILHKHLVETRNEWERNF